MSTLHWLALRLPFRQAQGERAPTARAEPPSTGSGQASASSGQAPLRLQRSRSMRQWIAINKNPYDNNLCPPRALLRLAVKLIIKTNSLIVIFCRSKIPSREEPTICHRLRYRRACFAPRDESPEFGYVPNIRYIISERKSGGRDVASRVERILLAAPGREYGRDEQLFLYAIALFEQGYLMI
jgi:hypothetical protein